MTGLPLASRRECRPCSNLNVQSVMKKTLTLFCSAFLVAGAQAQLLTIRDSLDNVVNGMLVVKTGMADEFVISEHLDVTLEGNVGKVVNVRRYELEVLPQTQNYFCWGVCYGPQDAGAMPAWSSLPQHSITMSPGQVYTNFGAYHSPLGQTGSSTYRFVWYDVGAPTDTAWCDIEFLVSPVGINEATASGYELSVFPNPSMGADVRVNFTATAVSPATRLVVYNALGEAVHAEVVRAAQQSLVINAGELSTGVYFATLENKGTMLATQRFVGTGH